MPIGDVENAAVVSEPLHKAQHKHHAKSGSSAHGAKHHSMGSSDNEKMNDKMRADSIAAARPMPASNPKHKDTPKTFKIMGVALNSKPHSEHKGDKGAKHREMKMHMHSETRQPLLASDDHHLVFASSPPESVTGGAGKIADLAAKFYIDASSGALVEARSKRFVAIVLPDRATLIDEESHAATKWRVSKDGVLTLNKDQRFYACPDRSNGWALHIGVNDVCSKHSQFVRLEAKAVH